MLTVIPPDPQYEETFSGPMPLVEIVIGLPELDWQPNFEAKSRTVFERSKLVVLRRQVWNLEIRVQADADDDRGCTAAHGARCRRRSFGTWSIGSVIWAMT